MDAIVSLLDSANGERLEKLWEELCTRFGLGSDYAERYPHFSFLSAQQIEPGRIDDILSETARNQHPLSVSTAGLGYFSGRRPVIFLPVARTLELSQLHQRIWNDCVDAVVEPSHHFSPQTWIPHVTLALEGLEDIDTGEVISWLAELDLRWTIEVGNLAVISSDGDCRVFEFQQRATISRASVEG